MHARAWSGDETGIVPSKRFAEGERLTAQEKVGILRFAVREFGLPRMVLAGTGRATSAAVQFMLEHMRSRDAKADLMLWDLAGSSSPEPQVAAECLELLSRKGIVCLDGPADAEELNRLFGGVLAPILESPDFTILGRKDGERSIRSMHYQLDLYRRRFFVESARQLPRPRVPLVAVVVLTFQHESYVAQCLRSVFAQTGQFRLRILILDDASTDRTAEVLHAVISEKRTESTEIDFRVNPTNVGVVKNLAAGVKLARGCDYLTFCEGDDFWTSDTRIQEHIAFLEAHPECVMSFNTIERSLADGSSREAFADHVNNPYDTIDGLALACHNVIGNFSACFYDGLLVEVIPERLFSLYAVDWLFNLYCAQFGRLGHLKKPLSVYRQHQGGAWSGRPTLEKAVELWNLIAEYNSFLDYQYDQGLQQYKRKLLASLSEHSSQVGKFDVVVFDDVFPSPRSGFRLAEFTAYLNELPTSLVVTSGSALPVLGATPLPELIHAFQRRHPEIGNRVLVDDGTFPLRLARLVYVDFLTNAYALLPAVEEAQVPFAFTLYPGAGFALDDVACERRLKRVFASPCFQKVVVTQPVTHHYLVSKRLCPVEKIEMIWGVVMPQHTVASSAARPKKRWGFGKSRLDICFMAHRYMAHGEDKGFDVFVNTAALLRKRHEDIYFHVIGPYNAVVLDVSMIADRLEFHGPLDPEEFDTVLHNMDMIISPNISGKLGRGSFDGFPTASCIEAGLRGCAIFAVDEFNSGAGRFVDGEDIVLLVYDLQSIVERVESYYHDPALLRAVGEKGRLRILQLYSQQAQVAPRVRMLRDLLKDSFAFDAGKLARLGLVGRRGPRPKSRLEQAISRYLPERFKRLCRGYLGYIWRR